MAFGVHWSFQGNEKVLAATFMIITALGDQFCIMMSKSDDGKIAYSIVTLNFMAELTKLLIASFWFLRMENGSPVEFVQVCCMAVSALEVC